MRFKQRIRKASDKHRARTAWHDKFLWLPTRITHSADEERRVQEGALRTDRACVDARPIVWLETVERRVRFIRGCLEFQYRLKEKA